MNPRTAALIGSGAINAAVIALVVRWFDGHEARAMAPAPVVEPAPPPPSATAAPLEIVLLELTPPDASSVTTRVASAARAGRRDPAGGAGGAIRARAGRGGELGPANGDRPDAVDGGRAGAGLLAMRRGGRPSLQLAPGTLEAIAARGGGGPPAAPHELGRLRVRPGGRLVLHDAVADLEVEPDGTAHLHSAPDFEIKLRLPNVTMARLRAAFAQMIDDWAEEQLALAHVPRSDGAAEQFRAVPGGCDHYGDPFCGDAGVVQRSPEGDPLVIIPIIEGRADVVSWLAKKTGVGDLYAARKRALLDSTRAVRAERGAAYRAERLARSAELVHAQLARLWATTSDPAARREALFELWDDCAEGDGSLGEAGARARAMIVGWIHAHVPAGYPADELARMNARRTSSQPFAP